MTGIWLSRRDLQERIDKQREEMSQLRSEVVKAQSRQTFAEQRYLPCPHPLSPKAGFWLIYHKKKTNYNISDMRS